MTQSIYPKRVLFFLIAALMFHGTSVAADSISYSVVQSVTGPPLTYGERIIIRGEFKDFDQQISDCKKKPDDCTSKWLELTGLQMKYKVIRGGVTGEEKDAATTVNGDGSWVAQLDELPADSAVEFSFDLETVPKRSKIEEEVQNITTSDEFNKATISLFEGIGKDVAQQKMAIDNYLSDISQLIFNRFPAHLRKPSISPVSVDLSKPLNEAIRSFTILQVDFNSLKDLLKKQDSTVADALKAADNKAELDVNVKMAANNFKVHWEKATVVMSVYATAALKDRISVQSKVRTALSTSELERYVGIDLGAMFVPNAEELRKFMMVNIYWGPVTDKPQNEISSTRAFFQSRTSLAVGWDMGDISGNESSKIKANYAYSIGIGFRLNKYFRLTAGSMLYRSVPTGNLEKETYYGLSMDLTAFKTLQTMVSK